MSILANPRRFAGDEYHAMAETGVPARTKRSLSC